MARLEPIRFEYDFDHTFDFNTNFGVQDRAQGIVTQELFEDGLIDHGRQYIVLIGKKQMLINGEKQTRLFLRNTDVSSIQWKNHGSSMMMKSSGSISGIDPA